MPPIAATTLRESDQNFGQLLAAERLLRAEAEHRLANLLQFVSSNLERAACRINEPRARIALREAAEQVTSIGLMQRSLDHAPTLPRECAEARMHTLCACLEALLLTPSGHALILEIHPSARDLHISSDLARNLAIIVTELVINAAKHAFRGGSPGRVVVVLDARDSQIVCMVRDDGNGTLPSPGSTFSQGMRLTETLATAAGGRCRWLFTRLGTEVEVLLPVTPPPRQPLAAGQPARLVQLQHGPDD